MPDYQTEIASLKYQITAFQDEIFRKDSLLADSVREIEKVKTVKVTEFKTRLVYIRDSFERLPITNDTIKMLVLAVEDADSIIQLDSAELTIWKQRYENQLLLVDTLQAAIPKIEGIYRGKIKSQEAQIKALKRWNTLVIISGSVLALLALVR